MRMMDNAPLRNLYRNSNSNRAPQGFRKRFTKQQEGSGNYGYNYQQQRNDPINFTNQYNIYNPVIGGPITQSPINNGIVGTMNAIG